MNKHIDMEKWIKSTEAAIEQLLKLAATVSESDTMKEAPEMMAEVQESIDAATRTVMVAYNTTLPIAAVNVHWRFERAKQKVREGKGVL